MLVSILITSYNYAPYLAAAIDSALSQTYPDVEVIIVDDGSTDESQTIISSYGSQVTSLFQENRGHPSALNAAFAISRGDVICLLDADDVFEPDKVDRVVAASRRAPDAHLIHHQMQIIDKDGKPMFAPFPRCIADGDIRSAAARAGGWFPHAVTSAMAFRRPYLERLFPLPEKHTIRIGTQTRDISLQPDTHLAGPAALVAPVAGIKMPLTRYRVHGNNFASRLSAADMLLQYETEAKALADVMVTIFHESPTLRLDYHVDYQLRLCGARRISRLDAAIRIMRSPSLPLRYRLRETIRMAVNRGPARR